MEDQEKNLEKTTNETNNLPDKEFEALVIRLLTKLGKRLDEHSENFNKELENIKKEPVRTEECSNWNEKRTRRN